MPPQDESPEALSPPNIAPLLCDHNKGFVLQHSTLPESFERLLWKDIDIDVKPNNLILSILWKAQR